jgi:Tat protein secretion system quality control protein TatD with DNase activity
MRFGGEKVFPHKLLDIAAKVGELKKIPIGEIERAQEENFRKLFVGQ